MCAWRGFEPFRRHPACPLVSECQLIWYLTCFLKEFAGFIQLSERFEGVCDHAENLADKGTAECGRMVMEEGRAQRKCAEGGLSRRTI
jgi:hypothetical protein